MNDRQRRTLLLFPARALPVSAAHPVDEPVAHEEDRAARGEPARDAALLARRVVGLLDELEGDRADQHAAAEGHDQSEDPLVDAPYQGDGAAQDQRRRSKQPPPECAGHGVSASLLSAEGTSSDRGDDCSSS